MRHFISIADTPTEELRHTLDVAKRLKKQLKESGKNDPLLAGKTLAMIFEKPSLRTRVSFAVAMEQLGGNGLVLRDEEVGLDKREATEDVARVLAGMCDGIMARTFEHEKIVKLAKYSKVPVINALTDYSHPCQAMADLMTIEEHFGNLEGRTLAYIGDGNNVARSLAVGCGKFKMKFILASPLGYELDEQSVQRIRAQVNGISYTLVRNPAEAAKTADVLYTDTWVSMGQEAEKAQRVEDFEGYQINADLLSKAPKHCIVLHCLPAYRGLEISADVMESNRSLVFAEAE
ncbi:MAG TPA: ornithine carbamoyltransferase, partial [Tepidisphaeraceae bacterium]|nr:ornithine carbamoyltransferase [Tepidisphaeraceae bacterium]